MEGSNRSTVEVDFDELKAETPRAWLIRIDEDDIWIPKSVCDLDEQEGITEIPEWLAFEKELI